MAFAALAAGVSGLQAFSDGVGVIADNITNVNTVGYKETRSRFTTLVTENNTLTSFSPGGVQARTQTLVSNQGLLQPSASPTDLAVDGSGFFVVTEDSGDSNAIQYTRAGSFTTDSAGNYINAAGLNLLGFRLNNQGAVINPATGQPQLDDNGEPLVGAFQNTEFLVPINTNDLNEVAEPTSQVGIRANLQSSIAQQAAPATQNGGEFEAGTLTADFSTSFQVFDSKGGSNTVQLLAAKTSPSTFSYSLIFGTDGTATGDRNDLADIHRGASAATPPANPAAADGLIGYGTIAFNTDGSLDLANSTMFEIIDDPATTGVVDPIGNQINLAGQSALTDSRLTIEFEADTSVGSASTNLAPLEINFDFGANAGLDGFTSFDSSTTLLNANVDGALLGDVNGVTVSENGDVRVIFDNGETINAFRIPVATFQNPDGLERKQGNAYGASDLSGEPILQIPGESGSGSIAANSLEQSTVDLANEFAELIRVQRAFSASTRIISTSDEILEELTRL